jgi:hypothetical protein
MNGADKLSDMPFDKSDPIILCDHSTEKSLCGDVLDPLELLLVVDVLVLDDDPPEVETSQ